MYVTDMNSLLHSDNDQFPKMKELTTPDSFSNYDHHRPHNHNHNHNHNHIDENHQRFDVSRQVENNSLMRYRSAPSAFFTDLLDDFLASPVGSSSNHDFFTQQQQQQNHQNQQQQHQQQQQQQQQNQQQQQQQNQQQQQQQLQQQQQKFETVSNEFIPYDSSSTTSMKLEPKETIGGSQQTSHLRRSNNNANNVYDNVHSDHNNMESLSRFRSMNSTNSNLIRQSSSPAGFLSTLNSESGFVGTIDVAKTNSSTRMSNNINFSSGPSSSSMFLPQIPENRHQINDSTFKNLKRTRDDDSITLERHHTTSLVHHLSLPKTSSEMAVAEKFLRFERDLDVPTNSRAKRGCATHPRSIAERVRRTRISQRMKKLQELFPNMDKQTSIADMLDMAVQYIKDLQKDLETLRDARSSCACSSKQ